MPPPFIQRVRQRFDPQAAAELPPPPPDIRGALEQWETFRDYAAQVASIATATAEANRHLLAENAALQRQVEHLMNQNDAILRDNRTVHAYAQNLRSRLTAIREALQNAENESLEFATVSVRTRIPTAQEDQDAEEVREVLSRVRPQTQPPAPPPTPAPPPMPPGRPYSPNTDRLPVNQF
jgi:hypothetical protein